MHQLTALALHSSDHSVAQRIDLKQRAQLDSRQSIRLRDHQSDASQHGD
jgi:hypothetical protein